MNVNSTILVICGFLLLLMTACPAKSGGISWLFQIERFEILSGNSCTIVLRPLEKIDRFPSSCKTITVNVQYASWKWFLFGGESISREKHGKALLLIERSYSSNRTIRFGEMGEGFGSPEGKASCVLLSRALVVEKADNGIDEIVYSYFKWP